MPSPGELIGQPAAPRQRSVHLLLAGALALFLVGALRDLTAPWEDGLRGENAAIYEERFVHTILDWPASVSCLAPGWVFESALGPVCHWHWHHPPLFPLTLAAFARVLGNEPWVLRLTTILLVLPAFLAMRSLAGRAITQAFGGLAALLFAGNAMVGYFLPMVCHDGATIAAGLCACASFLGWCERPAPRRLLAASAWFLAATLFDFLGHFWGLAMFVLALGANDRRAALRGIAVLFCVSLLSLAIVALHYGTFLGGPTGVAKALAGLAANPGPPRPTSAELLAATRNVMFDYGSWSIWALALLGAAASAWLAPTERRRVLWLSLALLLPGTLGCIASLRHYVDHAFWSMPMMAGAATLAAVAPWVGVRRLRAGTRAGSAQGYALLLATFAGIAHGAGSTHSLVHAFRPNDGGFAALAAEAEPHTRGAAVALTNRKVPMRAFVPGLMFVGSVATAAELDAWLDYGRRNGISTDVAFVLVRASADPGLVARLGQLAEPRSLAHVSVYRFRP